MTAPSTPTLHTSVTGTSDKSESQSEAGAERPGAAKRAPAVGAPAGPPEAAPLGSTQSKCTAPFDPVEQRRIRWAARAALWEASTLKPVRCCGRNLAPVVDRSAGYAVPVERHHVDVRRHQDGAGSMAGYGGLMTCGSVWACPRCSAVISAERSAEIAAAVAECHKQGGSVHFVTLTLRHRREDRLADLFTVLSSGWRGVAGSTAWAGSTWTTKQGQVRRRVGDRERFGVAGYVRVIETTVSRPGAGGHGWHLHVHALMFTLGSLSVGLRSDVERFLTWLYGHPVTPDVEWLGRVVFSARLFERWARGVQKAGGRAPGVAAIDLRTVADGGAEFVGRYLAKSTYDVATRLGAELAAGDVTKTAKDSANVSPFGLLRELITDGPRFGIRTPRSWEIINDDGLQLLDVSTGELAPIRPPGGWALWTEWEQATSGRRQIAWALKPKRPTSAAQRLWLDILNARGTDADQSDEEVAARDLDGITLGGIARADWYARMVWRPSWLVKVLETAEQHGASGVRDWMTAHGIAYDSR